MRVNHQKRRRIYIDKLIEKIKSSEYQEYIEKDERYREFLESKALLKVWGFTLLDTYGNKAMNKLIKGISKLNGDRYQVDLSYRPKKIRDLNYFSLQYAGSSQSSLATVKFLEDKYIREVDASFTQVNNNQAVVEFRVSFNKIMDNNMLLEFIEDNKNYLYKRKFIGYYNLEHTIETMGYSDVHRMFEELLDFTVQSKIMEISYLNYGLIYKLPTLKVINYPENPTEKESFRDVFLRETYEIRNGEQYLITDKTEREGLKMELYFTGKRYSPFTFTSILSNFRMDFYYFLFERIEHNELNQKMNKYFNEAKNKISSKDYKWLVNKIRAINDNKLHLSYQSVEHSEVKDWRAFYGGEEKEIYFTNNKYVKKYETIYTECLNHINILYAVGKENLIINVAVATLVTTFLGIGVTILMTFL